MPVATTTAYSNLLAHQLLGYIANNSLYMMMGREIPWPNEIAPDGVGDNFSDYKTFWDFAYAATLVTQNQTTLVFNRVDWVANTVYTGYTDTNPTLFNSKFYILTSNNEVYKCLSNNNGGLSSVMPTGLGTSGNNYIQQTSDGYVWKYMMDVDPTNLALTSFFVPVPAIAPVNSNQWLIQQAATPGSIDWIQVNSGGINYANLPNSYCITISGDGTGANAYANVVGGAVQNIVIVDGGLNYTYATVTINDGLGQLANATAIISPQGGHGSHTDLELGANAVMVAISLFGNVSGYFTTTAKMRQVGLMLNPELFGANTVSDLPLANTAYKFNVISGVGTFQTGEPVYQGTSFGSGTFTGTVIDFDAVNNILRVNNTTGTPLINNIIYGSLSGAQRYILNITNPDLQRYTGTLISQDNFPPVGRSIIQTEAYRFVLQF